MTVLTTEERKALKPSQFVFPKSRRYPIPDKAHARNALARVAQNGTAAEKRKVCEAVARKFPSIHETHCSIRHTVERM